MPNNAKNKEKIVKRMTKKFKVLCVGVVQLEQKPFLSFSWDCALTFIGSLLSFLTYFLLRLSFPSFFSQPFFISISLYLVSFDLSVFFYFISYFISFFLQFIFFPCNNPFLFLLSLFLSWLCCMLLCAGWIEWRRESTGNSRTTTAEVWITWRNGPCRYNTTMVSCFLLPLIIGQLSHTTSTACGMSPLKKYSHF